MPESLRAIAKMIDHSLLHPTLTDQELTAGCELAKKYDVASVCIKPYVIQLAIKRVGCFCQYSDWFPFRQPQSGSETA